MTAPAGYDVLARVLREQLGDDPVFGLLGDANLAPMARFAEMGGTLLAARHESAAVGMATGYARATGRVAVTTMTRGPGFTNALTGLVTAVRDRVPLVALAGGSPLSGMQNNQVIDEAAFADPTNLTWVAVTDGGTLAASVTDAMVHAVATRSPIVVHIPSDVLHQPASDQRDPGLTAAGLGLATAAGLGLATAAGPVDLEAVEQAAGMLATAERPIILVGRGVLPGPVVASIRELAAAVGALLVTSLPMKGMFDGDPFDLGFMGGFALPRTRELVDAADVALVLGASLNRYTMADGAALPAATIVQVDPDPRSASVIRRPDMIVRSTAEATVPALLAALGTDERTGYRTDAVRHTIEASRDGIDLPVLQGEGSVDPRWALRELDQGLDPGRRIVIDIGHFSTFPCQVLPIQQVGQLIPAFGFAAVGMGLSTAIGASRADDRGVHLVLGDGGLLMSLGELETARRIAGRLLITVLNDAAYGAEVHHLRRRGLTDAVARFPRTDFTEVARALGIPGVRLGATEDLPDARRLIETEPLALVDVAINPEVVSDRFKHAAEGGAP